MYYIHRGQKLITSSACNILAVKAYGEAEFWLSGGKVLLILILYCFTFVTMVGGNPQKDAYGFRHWRDPGPMPGSSDLGRFEGFLGSLWAASFCIVGPEYISMVSGEAKRPRAYIKTAFKTVLPIWCLLHPWCSLRRHRFGIQRPRACQRLGGW